MDPKPGLSGQRQTMSAATVAVQYTDHWRYSLVGTSKLMTPIDRRRYATNDSLNRLQITTVYDNVRSVLAYDAPSGDCPVFLLILRRLRPTQEMPLQALVFITFVQ